jgi:protein ImuA
MRWVTAHLKEVLICDRADEITERRLTGFEESLTGRTVHELLFQPAPGDVLPLFPAMLTARAVVTASEATSFSFRYPRKLVWVDSTGTFYPPAVMSAGISLEQICVLRPRPADLVWATIEALRCRSIGAVIATITQPLTRVEVRRLQLAAETGGGVAVLIRPHLASAASHIYAATTRWLVTPTPGERTIQRWHLQLIHGHGRQIGQTFLLEKNRASGQIHFMPLPAPLVDHPAIPAAS